MGILFAFFVGWRLGARGGEQGYEEVVTALKDVRDSDEFGTLIAVARNHGGQLLHNAADWLQSAGQADGATAAELFDRVRSMVQPGRSSAE
jgi:hypothetical protein